MEDICLEDLWKGKLRCKQWTEDAIQYAILHWSPSTLISYDCQLKKYCSFVKENGEDPEQPSEQVLTSYFAKVIQGSVRPKSLISTNSAALTCFFQALDKDSPVT